MHRRILSLFILATALLVGAGSATVITDYDHNADFSKYKTYSWRRLKTGNAIWDQRVREAIASQLVAKGWIEVESGGDILVDAVGFTRVEREEHATLNGFRDPFTVFGDATVRSDVYAVGTLIVQISEGAKQKLVWWSMADDPLSPKPEKSTKQLQKSVRKMFEHFPPARQGSER